MKDDQIKRALLSHVEKAVEDASMKMVPASAIARTTEGRVLVANSIGLLHRTAADLRAVGFSLPLGVPDEAVVRNIPQRGLVFCWQEAPQ